MSELYNYVVKNIAGEDVSLEQYKNKVILVVNVASKCGFTSQYEAMESLYKEYHKAGLEILGFPCNQFGAQEPGNEAEIKEFCSLTYNISFPLFSKVDVNGEQADPLFNYLKAQAKGIMGSTGIKWNFTKFLIDRNGNVLNRYAPKTKPTEIESIIKELL